MKPSSEKAKSASKVSSRGSLEGHGKSVPKLRFPGFKEEWENKQLCNECVFFSGGTPASTDAKLYNGAIPFIRSAEIDNTTTKLFLSAKGIAESSAKEVRTGDLLLAMYGANSGDVALSKINGAINQAILCIRSETINTRYLKFLLERDKKRITSRYLQGGQGNLSAEIIRNLRLMFPSQREQESISRFIEMVESRIAAQRKLVALLKKQKRGLLREIFERNAEGKCKSFYDIVVRRSEKITPTKDSGLDCIELEHIEPETGLLLGSVQLREQDSLKNLCKPNDIVFGKLRPYLRKFLFAKTECAVSSETWVLTAADGILPKFLFYLIQSEPFMQAANVSSGTKMPRSEWSNVANAKFHIPNAGRQLAIANCLSEVDTRIHQTQRVISAMEVYKRGLLQALFV